MTILTIWPTTVTKILLPTMSFDHNLWLMVSISQSRHRWMHSPLAMPSRMIKNMERPRFLHFPNFPLIILLLHSLYISHHDNHHHKHILRMILNPNPHILQPRIQQRLPILYK